MLNIPDSIKNLFKADGVRKNFRAHFPNGELPDITNDNIVQESVRFTESLCSQDVFKFGLAEASMIEFETVGVANMYGMWIECSCEIDTSSLSASELASAGAEGYDGTLVLAADSDLGYGFYRVPYGVFRVESCPRDHQAMAHRRVVAFSKSVDSLAKTLPQLPSKTSFNPVRIDPSAFLAQMTGENLDFSDVSLDTIDTLIYSDMPYFYDQTGTAYWIYVTGRALISTAPVGYRQIPVNVNQASVGSGDFARVNIDFDQHRHFLLGETIAKVLTENGYAFHYDNKGRDIYKSNRKALMEIAPYFFYPIISMEAPYVSSIPCRGFVGWTPVKKNMLIPVLRADHDAYSPRAFGVDPIESEQFISGPFSRLTYLGFDRSYLEGAIEVYYSVSITKVSDLNGYIPDLSIDVEPPDVVVHSIEAAQLKERSSCKILYEGNESETFPVVDDAIASGSGKVVPLTRYSYSGIDLATITDNYLELCAQFGKVDRSGSMALFHLLKESTATLGPNDYSNFWLDEYSVDNIGAVKYTYTDENKEQQVRTYKFGPGSSTYDMTSNKVIEKLSNATPEYIESLIDELFVPHLSAINFTPIDLSMKGLPYIEDGDYLTVAAQDGSLVESFNLEHTVKGAQVLSAEVKSVSGEILESWGD